MCPSSLLSRGVYDAAVSMYDSLVPLVREHLACAGPGAKIAFAGHSLGGSLATVLTLLMVHRWVWEGWSSCMCGQQHLALHTCVCMNVLHDAAAQHFGCHPLHLMCMLLLALLFVARQPNHPPAPP